MKSNKRYFLMAVCFMVLFANNVLARVSSEKLYYKNQIVTLDIYNPERKNCPVVILIHGAAGISGDRAIRYAGFAGDLMRHGIIAINVHYFESSRNKWIETIRETISFAEKIKNADSKKIGLVGYSLGGTLAIKTASIDKRVTLLAVNAGFLPHGFFKKDAEKLPKTFMIAGDKDTAYQTLLMIKKWRNELNMPIETEINKGLGHNNIPMNIFNENWKSIVKFFVRNFD